MSKKRATGPCECTARSTFMSACSPYFCPRTLAYQKPSQASGDSHIGGSLVRRDFRLGTPGFSDASLR